MWRCRSQQLFKALSRGSSLLAEDLTAADQDQEDDYVDAALVPVVEKLLQACLVMYHSSCAYCTKCCRTPTRGTFI